MIFEPGEEGSIVTIRSKTFTPPCLGNPGQYVIGQILEYNETSKSYKLRFCEGPYWRGEGRDPDVVPRFYTGENGATEMIRRGTEFTVSERAQSICTVKLSQCFS